MIRYIGPVVALTLAPAGALAEEMRELGAHEHGSGALNIAIEGDQIAMELEAPGADIVGFEYVAKTDADLAAVEAAKADLAQPLDLFVMPAEAGCTVTAASVTIIGEDDHGDEHDDHGHEEASHDDDHDHEEASHDDEHGHEEAGHDDEHGHDDHDDHAGEEAVHNEYHAEYALTCADPSAITQIQLAYFDRFENAEELDVQVVSDAGASAFEVSRENPVLDLSGML